MVRSDKTPLFAVIDIGSGQVNLKIAQIPQNGHKLQLLEEVTKSLPIGRDTFSSGRISPEMLEQLCQTLSGFRQLMREYKVRRYRAVATSAFREAKNREYVLEQIKVQTNINVEILGGSQERYYTQMSVRHSTPSFDKLRKEGVLVLNIGSGTLQMCGYGKNGLEFNQSYPLGSLRIRQLLSSVEENSLQFPRVLEEYVLTHIGDRLFPFNNLIVTGAIVDRLRTSGILSSKSKKSDFDQVYARLLSMPVHTLAERYHLETGRAQMVLPAMILIHTVWTRLQKSDHLLCPHSSMTEGILLEIAGTYLNEEDESFRDDIISGARVMAMQYSQDEKHVNDVMEKAMLLFDKVARNQGLTSRHRMLLQIAVLFHDSGKTINVAEHDVYSAMLVLSSDIVGLSAEEQKIVSLIVRYHEDDELDEANPDYLALTHKNRMVVSKLIAILKLSNAMDASHKQKLTQMSVTIKEGKLRIRMTPRESYVLEKWMFDRFSAFFYDVFGLEPQLKITRE